MERRLNDPEWSPTSPGCDGDLTNAEDLTIGKEDEEVHKPVSKEEKDKIIQQLQTEVEQQVSLNNINELSYHL